MGKRRRHGMHWRHRVSPKDEIYSRDMFIEVAAPLWDRKEHGDLCVLGGCGQPSMLMFPFSEWSVECHSDIPGTKEAAGSAETPPISRPRACNADKRRRESESGIGSSLIASTNRTIFNPLAMRYEIATSLFNYSGSLIAINYAKIALILNATQS
jgi:hypothetical protein